MLRNCVPIVVNELASFKYFVVLRDEWLFDHIMDFRREVNGFFATRIFCGLLYLFLLFSPLSSHSKKCHEILSPNTISESVIIKSRWKRLKRRRRWKARWLRSARKPKDFWNGKALILVEFPGRKDWSMTDRDQNQLTFAMTILFIFILRTASTIQNWTKGLSLLLWISLK